MTTFRHMLPRNAPDSAFPSIFDKDGQELSQGLFRAYFAAPPGLTRSLFYAILSRYRGAVAIGTQETRPLKREVQDGELHHERVRARQDHSGAVRRPGQTDLRAGHQP